MDIPFFFIEHIAEPATTISLNEDTSRHIAQVLRMKIGERIRLTNGQGLIVNASIVDDHKRSVEVQIIERFESQPRPHKTAIGISLIKNTNRFEWFLEKSAELGITQIIPLICARTEKQHFRLERMRNILISAMLQSQQAWMTAITEPMSYEKYLSEVNYKNKFIAHCMPGSKLNFAQEIRNEEESVILIGPEGDFSESEINEALIKNFTPVSLGNTRLRTETAGICAAVIMQMFHT